MCSKEVQLAISLFEAIDDVNLSNIIVLLEKFNSNPNRIIPKMGISPIHFVCGHEDEEFSEKVVELFLKKKGDPNLLSVSDHITPMMIACIWNKQKIVKMLLDAGADLNLKCNEGLTAIMYAVQENNYEIIDTIKKFVFEQKIEKKKKEIASICQITQKREIEHLHTPVKNFLTTALQNIEQKKFTPNRINYNFDSTSPYFINITHRRRGGNKNENESKEENRVDDKDDDEIQQKNLFDLTEKNLKQFSKQMNNAIVVERIAIHKRKSYIAEWREKIQKIRKSDKLDLSYINFLDKCNDVSLLRVDNRTDQENSYCSNDDDILEIKSSNDSFVTANSDLQRCNNAIKSNFNNDLVKNEEKPLEYIENYEEDYIYSDAENNIVFYEKKILSKSQEMLNRMNECAIGDSSVSTVVTMPPLDYDTDALRTELKSFGHIPGPITKNTKKLYLKKLVKFKKFPERLGIVHEDDNNSRITYPLELQRTITNYDYLEENIGEFLKLETKMVNHFLEKSHLKWREGNAKTSFVYLLLDPRTTADLTIHHKQMSKTEVWERFLKAIFYVGKGKSSRPYNHLYDAIKIFKCNVDIDSKKGKKNEQIESKKLKRIVEIWQDNFGVVCLHVFHNISPVEAYSREASIIETIGLNNLTNLNRGNFYGKASTFTMRQKRQMGVALLHRILHVYLAEGESQMKPNDF